MNIRCFDSRHPLALLWFLLLPGTLINVAPGAEALDLDDDHVMTRPFRPGLGSGRLLGSKMMDNDDNDDSDFILSTNVVASSSVGGLSGTPGLLGGASLLSTGPGSVSASLGGTYDFLGTQGGLGLPPIFGISDDDLDLDLDLDDLGLGGRSFYRTPSLFSRRSGLGSRLRAFKPASLGPRLTYVTPRRTRQFFGAAKRRYRPRFKPFGRRRKNFWWKGRRPRFFRRKFRPMKWRKKFPFFG